MSRDAINAALVLLTTLIAQITVFNHNYLYGVSINLVWIVLVIMSPNFNKNWVVPIAVFVGYMSAAISNTEIFVGSLNGFFIGLFLLYILNNSYWSLKWVRLIAAVGVMLLIDVEQIAFNQISTTRYVLALLPYYLLIISLFSIFLVNIIREPSYE